MDVLNLQLENIESIIPKVDGRSFIIGQSGCGKTLLAKALMMAWVRYVSNRLIVIDFKGEFRLPGANYITRPVEIPHHRRMPVIYQPSYKHLFYAPAYSRLILNAYLQQKTLLYVDEMGLLGDAQKYPEELLTVFLAGRSRKVAVLSTSQRPVDIPKPVMTESNTFYAFWSNDDDDVRRLRRRIPSYDPQVLKEAGEYSFYFQRGIRESAVCRIDASYAESLLR